MPTTRIRTTDNSRTASIERSAQDIPLAIEQDLVWRPAEGDRPGTSIVSHGEPFDGREPSLRDSFFERIRPLVERALRDDSRRTWPLIILNLDLKSNDPEHLRALWTLLGEYEGWLTTAERTRDGSQPAPLDVKPVLVLTGSADAQAAAFSDAVPIGARLRLFGAIVLRHTGRAGDRRGDGAAAVLGGVASDAAAARDELSSLVECAVVVR